MDVQALLNANACLSCHAIAQKIVGPSYQDLSARYKGDAQALSKLEASIRQGSVGKRGDAPMPTYLGLSVGELESIGRVCTQLMIWSKGWKAKDE